jgi:DNA-binding LacI/PurR family transcriptional regulator
MPKTGEPRTPREGASRKKYASSVDVAKLAGVSQSAVSRAFAEGGSVSAKTRQRVMAAAETLGYRPSLIPRIMLTHRSSLIAIVIGGMYNPFYAGAIEIFSREIQKNGSNVLLFSVDHGEYIDEVIPLILGYRVDGIISALSIISAEAAESCAKMKIPVVLFNGKIRNDWIASVCSDNVAGGRDIASLFIRKGGKRFAFIAGKKGNMANEDRMAGYFGRLIEHGVSDIPILYGSFRYEGGYSAAVELMKRKDRPDAIFCANDLMAIGAIEAIRSEFGLNVPQDVMVAGFDDIPAAGWPSLQLTTVRQDAPRMVEEALGVLERMIEGQPQSGGSLRLIAANVVERKSTDRKS